MFPSWRQILAFIPFAVALFYIQNHFGSLVVDRIWGGGALAAAVFYSFHPVTIRIGNRATQPLTGWRKAALLSTFYILGLGFLLIPNQFGCALHARGYICP